MKQRQDRETSSASSSSSRASKHPQLSLVQQLPRETEGIVYDFQARLQQRFKTEIEVPTITELTQEYLLFRPIFTIPVQYIRQPKDIYEYHGVQFFMKSSEYEATNSDLVCLRRFSVQQEQFESVMGYFEKIAEFHEFDIELASQSLIIKRYKERVQDSRIPNLPENVLKLIFHYWLQRRQELARPLLRFLWKKPRFDCALPLATFRSREPETRITRPQQQLYLSQDYSKVIDQRRVFMVCMLVHQRMARREREQAELRLLDLQEAIIEFESFDFLEDIEVMNANELRIPKIERETL